MSDDLVKRLRRADTCIFPIERDRCHCGEAADRIEKLDEEVNRLVRSRNKWGQLYNKTLEKLRLSVMADSEYVKAIDEKCSEQASRIEKLEALVEQSRDDNSSLIDSFDKDFLRQEARIEKLEAALQWYAEHCRKGGDEIEGPFGDYGQRARNALEETK